MLTMIAATAAFAAIVVPCELALRKVKRVGGISFLRLGRVQMSFSVARRIPAKRIRFATNA